MTENALVHVGRLYAVEADIRTIGRAALVGKAITGETGVEGAGKLAA